jgi:hypothetical protein
MLGSPKVTTGRLRRLVLVVLVVGLAALHVMLQLAYVRVERQTNLHGTEFLSVLEAEEIKVRLGKDSPLVYFKVLHYVHNRAKLFVVFRDDQDHRIGLELSLRKESERWVLEDERLVWASHGSADGWTWPPYGYDGALWYCRWLQ